MEINKIYTGDNLDLLKNLPDNYIDLIVTSPNYNNWRNRRTQESRKEYWGIYLLVSLACYIVFFIIKNHHAVPVKISAMFYQHFLQVRNHFLPVHMVAK